MERRVFIYLLGVLFLLPEVFSQTRAVVGLHDNTPGVFALINTRVINSNAEPEDNCIIVIRDGIIEQLGPRVDIPEDAWIIDMNGKTAYPGFIDLWVENGFSDTSQAVEMLKQGAAIPDEHSRLARQMVLQMQQKSDSAGASHWNPQVRSWFDAARHISFEEETAKQLRSQGLLMVNQVPPQGILRGQTALMVTADAPLSQMLLKPYVAQVISFKPSDEAGGNYPSSLMGTFALIRQTLYDAQWYQLAHQEYSKDPSGIRRPETNVALHALDNVVQGKQTVMFDALNELSVLRAAEISKEFGLSAWIKASGYEYRRLDQIASLDLPLILPLDFPSPPKVDAPHLSMDVSLEDLLHWEFAPENPARLHQAGVEFALTSFGLKDVSEFIANLRKAVDRGLPPEAALKALTLTPARMLGMENQIGSIEAGKMAHLIITDGDLFDEATEILEVWIDGLQFDVKVQQEESPEGKWIVKAEGLPEFDLVIFKKNKQMDGNILINEAKIDLSEVSFDGHRLSFSFKGDTLGVSGLNGFSAAAGKFELFGNMWLADGQIIEVRAKKAAPPEPAMARQDKTVLMAEGPITYPFIEFGYAEMPEQPEHLFVRNAVIWTQGPQGKLEDAQMLISSGRIVAVGKDLKAPRNAVIIDAEGKHVTPGLIDPHSHASILKGVNETGNAIVAETRIQDVISGDNIWTYRQLAGGLTTASLLHGSANPVGGQNAVIKMRWGALPDDMILKEASPGLKMALGENVKGNTSRYPNTRMGTEQIIRDAFLAARDYKQKQEYWEKYKKGIPPRKNLQMEVLLEVLEGKRLVHAHAYRQDEIQMLLRLAKEIGFKIASFEHTVEGYKVADVLESHGAAAIVWTDWSSFKIEAYDGILYNARMLLEQGVLTSLHSDNTQLSTRMNWEAGKLLSTGIDETAAMDLITINPARILGADEAVGSLEPGKHADFVIWNTHPLSGFSHAEQTWVDGRKYFDRQQDADLRKEVAKQRASIIRKIFQLKEEKPDSPGITRKSADKPLN